MIYYFALFLLLLFLFIAASYEFYAIKTGVDTFPSMPAARQEIIRILQNDFATYNAQPYLIIDLGSGSGQLSWRIACAMPQAHIIGIELSFVPWLRSALRQKLFGPKNLEYKRMDFWSYDVSAANAVITYLPGKIMERVSEKLRKELEPGVLVAANVFPLRGSWTPIKTIPIHTPLKTNLFIYQQT